MSADKTDKEKFESLFYPGTETLINRFGEKDPKRLAQIEREVSNLVSLSLRRNPINGDFDIKHLTEIHKRVFDPIYPWAGQVRDFTLTKLRPDGFVTVFAHPQEFPKLAHELKILMDETKKFTAIKPDEFPQKIAHAYQIINEMHTFREGNGRVHRLYLDALAKNAGYKLDFEKLTKDAWNYAASMSGRIYAAEQYIPGRRDELEKVFKHIVAPANQSALSAYAKGRIGAAPGNNPMMTLADLNPKLAAQKGIRLK
jgi:cell filamentation protein